MKCIICIEDFNLKEKIPYSLDCCGKTICLNCIQNENSKI